MKIAIRMMSLAALLILPACTGSREDAAPLAPPTGLFYVDPSASPSEWKLMKDASSTKGNLVLNLVGPSDGTKFRGVGFTLQTDTTLVKFVKFKDSNGKPQGYYKDGGIFRDTFLDTSDPTPVDIPPTLQVGGVNHDKLMVGIFQKGDDEIFYQARGILGPNAKSCNATVLQVAIGFDEGLKAPKGNVPLKVLKARVMPQHVDGTPAGQVQDIPLKVGTLTLE